MSVLPSRELLKSLLLLQYKATMGLMEEYHQTTEAFIQQAAMHPLIQENDWNASHEHINLREAPPMLASSTLLSDLMAEICREVCDSSACIPTTAKMGRFLERVQKDVKSNEDKVQALFIIDITLQTHQKMELPAGTQTMSASFEQDKGYEMLCDWFIRSCSYNDEANKQFAKLVLQILHRNKPQLTFTRKTILNKIRNYMGFVKDKESKELLLQVVNKYKK